ncbi:DUF4422 domain-containing protein [Vibrio parahaemolyticus]|uniref:DUF4422 domain-containing protein n=1 Tax=Vibrio parahaemolyticus TaxID=670 RepID=UPI0011213D65|nr:DUF4422 domain-containing protein [Vibrio parahaemolyticus]TOI33686.1 glycosyl transferase [Vibrio parahaemolyticus]
MSIYIASHKEINYSLGEPYKKFLLGSCSNDCLDEYIRDCTGDNIAYKNSRYCELTGYYWLWKNSTDEYIGLVHYRRHFQSSGRVFNLNLKSVLTNEEIIRLLNQYDIVLPKKRKLKNNIREEYCRNHYEDDWELAKLIIINRHPEYDEAIKKIEASDSCFDFNMMIAKKELFDSYCEWLFPVLFEIENKIDYSRYDSYQSRVIGFLAERLLNVWIEAQSHLKIKEVKVIHTELSRAESVKGLFKDEVKRLLRCYE